MTYLYILVYLFISFGTPYFYTPLSKIVGHLFLPWQFESQTC